MNYCNLYYSALKSELLSSPGVLGNGTTIPAGVAKGPQVEASGFQVLGDCLRGGS